MDITIYQRAFDAIGNPAAQIRRDLTSVMRSIGVVDRRWTSDVLLVVTELVTNVCLHAESSGDISVQRRDGMLAIDVTDRTPAVLPLPRATTSASSSGRGLGIVEQLTSTYAVDVEHGRKHVRVQFPFARPPRN